MYLTLIHIGGAGQAEVAYPRACVGPFTTYQQADDAGEEFYQQVFQFSDQLRQECFHTVVQIPVAPLSVQDSADEFLKGLG